MTLAAGRGKFAQDYDVSRETMLLLELYAELLVVENAKHNLIAKSTESEIWERHILDSAQLLQLSDTRGGRWLDVGSGAGFPGIVLSLLTDATFLLLEPRRLRADFLRRTVHALALDTRVTVAQQRVEIVSAPPFTTITARAFAPLKQALQATIHLADEATTWLLHKGRNAAPEMAEARRAYTGVFTMHPSVTAPDASIIRVRGLRA